MGKDESVLRKIHKMHLKGPQSSNRLYMSEGDLTWSPPERWLATHGRLAFAPITATWHTSFFLSKFLPKKVELRR